eukprot:SM000110S18923  [mRNA]  locus=s110:283319:287945:+ [translate_table: standard]
MVQYGQYLVAHQVPGWEAYYIQYKQLKKRIKEYAARQGANNEEDGVERVRRFSEIVDSQVERTVLFLIEQQGLLAGRLQRLREQREMMEPHEQLVVVPQLLEAYREVGSDLLKLLQFTEVNATALRKILKKFDKQVGYQLQKQYYITRTNHPYSQLQQVLRQVGLGAMVGTISRNMTELLQQQRASKLHRQTSFSLYRQPSLPSQLENEPVIMAIEAARNRLTRAVSYNTFVANVLLLPHPSPTAVAEEAAQEVEYHWPSVQLNLANTFLYMVNYYIVVPSSDDYALLLGVPATLCGVIIGSMPLAAIVSAFAYSSWSNRNYTEPLVVSTAITIVGNLMYAMALNANSIWFLFLGRFLCGLGGARAVNRRYIADHVPLSQRTKASADFVSASALGLAVGPAAAGLLNMLDVKVFGWYVNFATGPGWVMAIAWVFYLAAVLLYFKEPPKKDVSVLNHSAEPAVNGSVRKEDGSGAISTQQFSSVRQRLLASSKEGLKLQQMLWLGDGLTGLRARIINVSQSVEEGVIDEDDMDKEEASDMKVVPSIQRDLSFGEAMEQLNGPVAVLLFVYVTLKLAAEVLVSESSVITKYYFRWSTTKIGLFLFLEGLTVLPVSAVVGHYISNLYDERTVIFWTELILAAGIVAILDFGPYLGYNLVQYSIAATIIYVSSNVLEGKHRLLSSLKQLFFILLKLHAMNGCLGHCVSMSLLSKVMSPKLARGTFNCGFLSTEAGTIARVIADGLISVCGYAGLSQLLNLTMLPTLAVAIIALIWTKRAYLSLY